MSTPILSVSDLAISFGRGPSENEVVSGVSLSLHKGKTLALVGESGSGKTITGRSLMGLLPPKARITRGAIHYSKTGEQTEDLTKATARRMRALRGCEIGMIFQEPMSSLSPFHTIGAQVKENLLLHGVADERNARDQCIDTFEKVGFAEPARTFDAYPFELSGGMRQRAMIAMATVCHPSVLIADEPTTALDVTTQALILDLIQKRQEETGMAVLLITHDLGVVSNIADHITVLRRGRVMEAGAARDLLTDPRHPYLKRLIEAAPDVDVAAAADPVPSNDLIIEARNISKTFVSKGRGLFGVGSEKIKALRDVDLTLPRGETVALVGESGSGKSTLANVVLNAISPDPGATLKYNCNRTGKSLDIPSLSGETLMEFRREVQVVFQDPYASLSPRMTVQDILSEPLAIHDVCSKKEARERGAEMLRRVGLDPSHLGRFPHAFSGGQRQRISIARALMLEPKLLICDEPTSALDVSVQAQVLDLLSELRDEFGLSYLFISHDLAVVSRLADEIAVMCRGAIVEQAPARRLFENPEHPYTKALMAAAPDPHPDRKLDLNAIALGAGARPEDWPEPYRYDRNDPLPLHEVGSRHYVRMTA